MILCDVNILIYAHREESQAHERYRAWLLESISGDEPMAVSSLVLSGFLRVVTHPRIFKTPSPLERALEFASQVSQGPSCVPLEPGPGHRDIFLRLCAQTRATGNAIPDAYLAALAIESGSLWITEDGGFARFPGLRWRRPDL